ncbi:MAG: HEAT repeat domain-containing protein, partial [Acidobacteria bacterium]|nr:HEAT repeat domain-containing protein [Acidobacteriota bacterium]
LIDDLHFSDEATLLLLRQMMLRQDIPLFICGTSTPIQQEEISREPAPLQRFFAAHHEALNIITVALTPLSATDIAQHFQQIFPQVHLPEKFEEHLAQVTQGNPLFIGEILRKLALDGKVINLAGNKSVIEPFEEDYLPRSLDEIVSEKIAVLDEESRQLLDQASTFGENVSLSMLTGNSDIRESKVLEFIDQAVAQGLISSEYQSNDETIRFLSKRILNLTYGSIQEDRKQELHESIGTYKESLYNQNLLPSAASLAYHFRLSANEEKARLYGDLTGEYDERIFSSEEAVNYTGEELPEPSTTKLRVLYSLDRNVAAHVPEVISALLTALREMEQGPPGSQAVLSATSQLKQSIDTVLEDHPDLHLTHAHKSLEVNGERVDVSGYKPTAEAFVTLMSRLHLRGIGFFPDLTEQELTAMLKAIGGISSKEIDEDFWRRFTIEQDLLHLELKQMHISAIAGLDEDPVLGTFQAKSQGRIGSTPGGDADGLVPESLTWDVQDSTDSVEEKPVEDPVLEPELEPEVIRQETVPELKISPGLVKLTDDFLKSAAHKLNDLLLKGDEVEAGKIIDQFFQPFARQTVQVRTQIIKICGNLLKDPGLTSQPQLLELLTDPLLLVVVEEEDPRLREEIGGLVSRTATNLIQFGDYGRAGRVLMRLQKRQRQLEERRDPRAQAEKLVVLQELDPKTQDLLREDLKSQESTRMQEATQLLGGLGPIALPLLIEIVKKEDDPRLRQIACQLLSELGPEASKLLKRELVLEGFAEQRVRILEVIDNVTRDLRKELAFSLEDESPRVRRAAFRLVERLNDERLTPLLFNHANHQDATIAVAAIKSLGEIKPAGAVDVLVPLLEFAKGTERVIAACRALGQIADPASIEPLAKIISTGGFFSLQRKRSPLVRATAAFALAQISDPRVVKFLARHMEDSDSRIRQTAHDIVTNQH